MSDEYQPASQIELDLNELELGVSVPVARGPRRTDSVGFDGLTDTPNPETPGNAADAKKIKFKRATKKMKNVMGGHYVKTVMEMTTATRFQHWSKADLVQLLISQSIELRNESVIDRLTLEDLCEALYKGRESPPKPRSLNLFEISIQNIMARRIQNTWVFYQVEKRVHNEIHQNEEYISKMEHLNHTDVDEIGQAEIMYMDDHHEIDIEEIEAEQEENHQNDDEEENDATQSDMERGGVSITEDSKSTEQDERPPTRTPVRTPASARAPSVRGKMTRVPSQAAMGKKSVNVLDLPWTPPDLQKARLYADYVQPRKGGKGGSLYKWSETTTGRHCYLAGCGEQFDAFEEGQISEFGIYGSGVTNYFKFMKWAAWLFGILAIISLPSLVLNIYGPNNSNSGLKELAKMTAGNLYPATNSTVDSLLDIPGCYGYELYNISCTLDRFRLAEFYSYLDIIISGTIFLAFLWLRKFERLEDLELNKNTVNASMFTVMIDRIPTDLTEEQLGKHFTNLLPREHIVASVSIAYDNADEIRECTHRGDLIRSKVRLVHEHRYNCTMIKKTRSAVDATRIVDRKREEFFTTMKRINLDLKRKEELLESYAKLPAKALFAFVTFDKVSGRTAALSYYNNRSLWQRMFPSPSLLMGGLMPRLQAAPEPSTIIWENLHYTATDRSLRRFVSTFSSLVLVAFSLVIIFGSKYLQETSFQTGQRDVCPSTFETDTKDQQVEYITAHPEYTHCYCDTMDTVQQSEDENCRQYWRDNINAQVLTYFASFVVLVVNALMDMSMRYSSAFEKHHTEDTKGKSVFIRLFVLKYINTSAIFLIDNNNSLMKLIGVQVSNSLEFSADWFNTIGVTIILVQLGDVFISHGARFYKYFMFRRAKERAEIDSAKTLTQDELNKLHVGPEFEFAYNYAQLMSTLFVCLTFATGIPILYIIAAANFLVFYLVEKFLFIHMYRIPPHFNSHIGKRATSLIPIALLFHIGVSIWMLSSDDLFYNPSYDWFPHTPVRGFGESLRDKISGKATFPLFVTLLVIGFLLLTSLIVKEMSKSINNFLKTCCGHCFRQTKEQRSIQSVISYSRAVQRNLIKGLKNYNILHNPQYKEAFGITWKFAFENKTVRSVRQMKSKAQASAEEDDAAKIEDLQRKFVKLAEDQHSPGGLLRASSNRGFSSSFYVPQTPSGPPPRTPVSSKTPKTPTSSRPTPGGGSVQSSSKSHAAAATPRSEATPRGGATPQAASSSKSSSKSKKR